LRNGRNAKKSKRKQAHVPALEEEEEHVTMHGSRQSDSQAFFESEDVGAHEVKDGAADWTDASMRLSPHEPEATSIEDEHPMQSVGEIIE
jgi:hypothetical protein